MGKEREKLVLHDTFWMPLACGAIFGLLLVLMIVLMQSC